MNNLKKTLDPPKERIEELTNSSSKPDQGFIRKTLTALISGIVSAFVVQFVIINMPTEYRLRWYQIALIALGVLLAAILLIAVITKFRWKHIILFGKWIFGSIKSVGIGIARLASKVLSTVKQITLFLAHLATTGLLNCRRALITFFRFVRKNKGAIILSIGSMIIGIVVSFAFQLPRFDISSNEMEPIEQPKPPVPETARINTLIFNANDDRGSENQVGIYLRRRVQGLRYSYQYNWWLKRTYDKTIVVYVSDRYRDRALEIAHYLPGNQQVLAYKNTPFVGLEKRDIVIFVGKDLSHFKA